MKLGHFVAVIVAFAAFTGAFAQQSLAEKERARRSDEIVKKARKIDILNQLLPVLLTKDQITTLLPELAKAREAVRKVEEAEYKSLIELEPKLDAAIKEGIDKQRVPKEEVLRAMLKTFHALAIVRDATVQANVEAVFEVVNKIFNDGQKAAARNALTPSLMDPTLDPKKMTDDQKLRFWVRVILLDRDSYDTLLEVVKKKSS